MLGNPKMMELLLNYLGDRNKNVVDMPDKTGLNPLLYVVKSGNLPVLKILLRAKFLNLDYIDVVSF